MPKFLTVLTSLGPPFIAHLLPFIIKMESLSNLSSLYNHFMEHQRDPRVDAYPLMSGPLPTLLICLCYVTIVKILGPRWMEGRAAYDLKKTLVGYNGVQVAFSAWLFYEYGRGGWFHGYNYNCQPVDYGHSPMALRMVHVCWWYYFSKFTEFFDTFFFILRKKNSHVSALHVIHHGVMPMSVWFGVKFTPGGHSTFFGLLNTFVHIIMYFYYMLSAMGPNYSKFLWWKKYLTWIQMLQFIGIAAHSFQLLFIDCAYPRAFVWWIGCHGLLFLVLFSNFYLKEYVAKLTRRKTLKPPPVPEIREKMENPSLRLRPHRNYNEEKGI